MKTKIIAHRGSSNTAPENTGYSFKQAVKDNADGVELDVHLTADKEVVVIHDEKIDRTSNHNGYVMEYTLKELKSFDFGSYFDQRFKDQTILTLKETLEVVKDLDIINIEIKKGYGINEGIEKRILESIEDMDLYNQVLISSFNHDSLKIIKDLNNKVKTAALLYAKLYKPWQYAQKLGVDYLHLYYKLIDKELVDSCQKKGIKVNTFTVNNVYDLKKMINCNVDGIITDYPLRALELLKGTNS